MSRQKIRTFEDQYINCLPARHPQKRKRIFEIDFLRGFAIILMVALHWLFLYSRYFYFLSDPSNKTPPDWLVNSADTAWNLFGMIEWGGLVFLEIFFYGLFSFLAGISCSFSKNNLERAIKLSYLAVFMVILVESAATILGTNFHLIFGIIQAMAVALLIYSLIDHFLPQWWVDFIIGIIFTIILCLEMIYALNYAASTPGVDFPDVELHYPEVEMTGKWADEKDLWKCIIGIARTGNDWFNLSHIMALVFFGAAVGKTTYKKKKSLLRESFPTKWAKPILWVGSKTVYIYVLHMPVGVLLLWAFLAPFGFTRLGV